MGAYTCPLCGLGVRDSEKRPDKDRIEISYSCGSILVHFRVGGSWSFTFSTKCQRNPLTLSN